MKKSTEIADQARGESLESMVAKTLALDGSSGEVPEDLEDVARGIGFVSYAGEHSQPYILLHNAHRTTSFPAGADTVISAVRPKNEGRG